MVRASSEQTRDGSAIHLRLIRLVLSSHLLRRSHFFFEIAELFDVSFDHFFDFHRVDFAALGVTYLQ